MGIFFVSSIFLILGLQGNAQTSSDSPDAIAIRIMPNSKHLSAAEWYRVQKFSGSPQSLIVDGYRGVRDGRTVYVNVANVESSNLYTNIYLISYNQKAEKETIDIFGNILSHWKFNINLIKSGHCRKNNGRICMSDSECALGDFCDSLKARVIRDTRRLEDLSGVNFVNPPSLDSGSYIHNFSISVWPSWGDALKNDLGYALPKDPVNDMGDCPSNYNIQTCWDEENKSFVNDDLSLPDSSMVYTYNYEPADSSAELCGVFESGLSIVPAYHCSLDVCIDTDGDGYGVFVSPKCTHHNPGDIDCNDTNSSVLNASELNESICFDGIDNDCDGFVDCDDPDCASDAFCLPTPGCRNHAVDPGEECDDGNSINTDSCTNLCKNAKCGDGIVHDGEEQCDDGANGIDTDECYDNCTLTYCGDNIIQDPNGHGENEECDGESYCTNCEIICTDNDGDGYIKENFNPTGHCSTCGPTHNAPCTHWNDCDDSNANIHPGHTEDCDGLDNNCSDPDHSDGVDSSQVDEGLSEEECSWVCQSAGYNYNGSRVGDLRCCGDDNDGSITFEGNPYQNFETNCTDGQDNDCDTRIDGADPNCLGGCGTTENDTGVSAPCNKCNNQHDDDGGETTLRGDTEQDWVDAGIINMIDVCDPDCGAGGAGISYDQYENPNETSCDGLDNDCDGEVDEDLGQTTCGEGVCENTVDNCVAGVVQICTPLSGNAVAEICGDGLDNNCDGNVDEGCASITCYRDVDGDGFGDASDPETAFGSCSSGYVLDNTDCDDNTANGQYMHPGGVETCDGLDNDCSDLDHSDGINAGDIDEGCDDDGDGYCDSGMLYFSGASCLEGDCDDDGPDASLRFPSNPEVCDGIDNDCDPVTPIDQGFTDEQCKYVCELGGYDWLGTNYYYPTAENYCCGNIATEQPFENPETSCQDGKDNDCDGDVDCDDDNCSSAPACSTCTLPFTFPCTFP